jgi:hypothetical protein
MSKKDELDVITGAATSKQQNNTTQMYKTPIGPSAASNTSAQSNAVLPYLVTNNNNGLDVYSHASPSLNAMFPNGNASTTTTPPQKTTYSYTKNAGNQPYVDQLNSLYNQIVNRKPFQYDLNGDLLYRQMADRYTQMGQQAMRDTMGQAAALTGGYGNSYAQSVGNQAYQQYLTALNDNVPELWDRAYQVYQGEGDRLLQQYQLASQHPGIIEAIKPRTVTVTRTPKEDPKEDPNANANDSYTQALVNAGLVSPVLENPFTNYVYDVKKEEEKKK